MTSLRKQRSRKRKANDSPNLIADTAVGGDALAPVAVDPITSPGPDNITEADNSLGSSQLQKESLILQGTSMDPVDSENKKNDNPYDAIRHCIVTNDGIQDNLVKLIGLKSLFAKQLPKMPKDYIVRLVFDRRHKSLALLSDDRQLRGGDDEIIGGICYRPYPEMRFAEIAFCAVSASQQVKVCVTDACSIFL